MITQKEYYQRRKRLAARLKNNSVGVVVSGSYKTRSHDTEFPFRQESNFYYLSGLKEDKSAIVFLKHKTTTKIYLFVTQSDPTEALWSMQRLGVTGAKKRYRFDDVYDYNEFPRMLEQFSKEAQTLYYDFYHTDGVEQLLATCSRDMYSVKNLAKKIYAMRLIKSPAEVATIQKAIAITQEAHHSVMHKLTQWSYEYEVQATLEYIFKKNGAYSDAYTSIVACGDAANTLHYIQNNKPLKNGELLLIDAGCEYNYYASDITRTIPVNGKFTKPQKELYALVLSVEKEIISSIKEGVYRSALQEKAQKLLAKGLVKLGILEGDIDTLIKQKKLQKFYPHGIGHWMGIDVHDPAPYKDKKNREIPLQAGMVLTIEPGLYINKNEKSIPKKYRGIGIRIEDDILVTKKGYINLSAAIIKEIDAIEKIITTSY